MSDRVDDRKPQSPPPDVVRANLRRWHVAMEASHEMLIAGLRHRIGPDGDIAAAYRQWNDERRARKMNEYEAAYRRRLKRQAEQKAVIRDSVNDHAT